MNLSNYIYDFKEFKVEIICDVAITTLLIHYMAEMRKRHFDIYSRVTTILQKTEF